MLQIQIDGKKVEVKQGATVIEAAHQLGTYIPHFATTKLSIAANCRMCLVDVEKAPNPCLPVPHLLQTAWWCIPIPPKPNRRNRA